MTSGPSLIPLVAPMEARLAEDIPVGDAWQYEPKWDGFRCLAYIRQGDVRRKTIAVGGDARRDLFCLEHLIDGAQHAVAGTERVLEFADQEIQSGALVRGLEMAPHQRKLLRRGVLE